MGKRIENLKNYNQVLLAIAGSLGILLLLFLLTITFQEIWRPYSHHQHTDTGILSDATTDQLKEEKLRKQIISFNKIQLVDSTNQLYLLPVTQADLASPEESDQILGLINKTSGSSSYRRFSSNIYNNLVLHDKISNESKIIFDQKVSIKNFLIHEDGLKKYIIIPACSIDSNNDGFLNQYDLQELFIFDIQKRSLHKIEAQDNYTTLNVTQPIKSNDLVVHFGIDRNDNGTFDNDTEPRIFYDVNLENMKIEAFIKNDQIQELQDLLEGK